MEPTRQISELSRQELHDLIWSTPISKLASDFGISDVAIAKRCKRQAVPRPSRGYWAKRAAGRNPPTKPLPPPPDEIFEDAAKKPIAKALSLPETTEKLHSLATELLKTVPKARLDSYGRASLQEPTLPEVIVVKTLTEKVAKAFDVVLTQVAQVGICFRKARSKYDAGYFQKGHDRLYLIIEEELVDSDGTRPRHLRHRWRPDNRVPSGRLTLSLRTERYGAKDAKTWTETDRSPLETVLAQVVRSIRLHFVEMQKRRSQEAIERAKAMAEYERRQREWQKQEEIRLQKEREDNHEKALATLASERKRNLVRAANYWRENLRIVDFIHECERRWKDPSGEFSSDQKAWLTWAKEIARMLSPFEFGYPDPAKDGPFDTVAVPFGGPYPPMREFPRPSAIR